MAITQGERITAVEVQVSSLNDTVKSMDNKLDDLIALRNRGIGAFTLAAALLGTGILSIVGQIFGWFHR